MTKFASILFALNLFACASQENPVVKCGDGMCEGTETATSCPADCKPAVTCGDKVCDATESTATCPGDCPETCGNGTCGATETSTTCAMDCAAQFKVVNNTTYTISSLYAWACGTSNNYVNTITGTMPPGYYVTFDAINPGCWNFQVYTTNNQTASDSNVTLKERVLTTWAIN